MFSRGRSVVRPKRLNFPIFVKRLEESLVQRIERTCKRIYRVLAISGYARIDLRLTPDNEIYWPIRIRTWRTTKILPSLRKRRTCRIPA